MKTIRFMLLMPLLVLSIMGIAQKPKKTYDAAIFAKKVKFSFTPEYINSKAPDAKALVYIAQKSGRPLDEVQSANRKSRENVEAIMKVYAKYGYIFVLDGTEVKVKQESPVKYADIVMHCSSGESKFDIILNNCVQTNISWYLGDAVSFQGELFKDLNSDLDNLKKENESPANNNNPDNEKLSDYEKEVMQAADQAHRAEPIDWFAGRPTTVDPSIASKKPEEPGKKESFNDRLNRIKADGNKVGVLVRCENLYVNPGNFEEGITKARVLGSYGPLSGLSKLAENVVEELNKGFGVDVFEVVDYSKVPVKGGNVGLEDDWWSTHYKIIFIYDLRPYYNAYYKTNPESGKREYRAQMRVDSEMIVMAAEDKNRNRLKYVTASPKPWGTFASDFFTGPSSTDFHIIQDLKAAINPPPDEDVINELMESQKEHITAFIQKKSR